MGHQYPELLHKLNEAIEQDDYETLKELVSDAMASFNTGGLTSYGLEHLRFLAEQYM